MEGSSREPEPNSLSPTVVVARDGRTAMLILDYEGHESLAARESLHAVAMYFTVRLVQKEPESRVRVVIDKLFWQRFEPAWLKLENMERPEAIMEVALAAIGSQLDTHGMPPHTPSGVSPVSIKLSEFDFEDQKPATDKEVFNYAAAKIYWGWKFGLEKTRFTVADRLRLGVPPGDIERVAIRGNAVYWEPWGEGPTATTPSYMTYTPTAALFSDFESGRLPGQSVPPIFQVQEKLSAPRYDAAREHFSKAAGYITSPTPDWPNAAKEAVSALESLAKIVTDRPNDTLGDVIKILRRAGKLPPPLDKTIEAIWGFANSTPGIRHSSTNTL